MRGRPRSASSVTDAAWVLPARYATPHHAGRPRSVATLGHALDEIQQWLLADCDKTRLRAIEVEDQRDNAADH